MEIQSTLEKNTVVLQTEFEFLGFFHLPLSDLAHHEQLEKQAMETFFKKAMRKVNKSEQKKSLTKENTVSRSHIFTSLLFVEA